MTNSNVATKSKWKRWHKWTLGIIGCFFLLMAIAVNSEDSKASVGEKVKDVKSDSAIRAEKIDKQFSAWDGDHVKLKKYISDHLKDPDSYKNIKTTYWDRDSVLVVKTEYSGTNSYGGRVRGTVMAKCSIENGEVLQIMASE